MLRFFLTQLYKQLTSKLDYYFNSQNGQHDEMRLIINMHIFVLAVQKNTHYMMIFDAFVILTCLTSLILCTRSVVKGIQLQRVGIPLSLEGLHVLFKSD